MKKLVTRSRTLVLVAVLAVVAAMCTVPTVHAASTTAGIHAAASHAMAASDTPCTIDYQSTTCQSTNPAVTVNNYFTGDQSGCSYVSDVTWGDGQSTTNVTYSDPGDGYDLLGNHTYKTAGTYAVSVTLQLTAGTCTANSFNAQFTLLNPSPTPSTSSPPPPPPSPTPTPTPSTSSSPPPLPTQPSPTFVCVTGPGGSCLQPGAGVPQPDTWTPVPPAWLTSPVVGGCALSIVELLTAIYAPEFEWLVLVEALGGAAYFEQSTGNLLFKLAAATPFKDCYELATYLLKHQPPPPSLQSLHSVNLADASLQSLFQPVSKSQLKKLGKLPFLSQRFGYIVAQVGSEAALSQKYRTAWSRGTQKSTVCQLQRGGYRCDWRFQYKGTRYTGYVLIGVTGNSYRLEKVV
jgi:hypothetical protein